MRNLILLCLIATSAQAQTWQALPQLPEAVTNNAVTLARVADSTFVYSFTGLNQSKTWSGIHLKAWRLQLGDTIWQELPPVPDPMGGKIAAGASTVGGTVYLIGGYHVTSNGSEVSSAKVHRFDPVSNAWLSDGADIPVPIDDHVQAVWRDSLIFVVTGWSNNTNVVNVQVYNPTTDSWATGTPLPNQTNFKVFGGSGTIIGDTLYYAGGARSNFNFSASTYFRKGYIHPDDPTKIDWLGYSDPLAKGYRMACVEIAGRPAWLGGSDVTYNYNGIAYNGSGGVPALDRITLYRPETSLLEQSVGKIPPIMDLRGAGQLSPTAVVLAGGMEPGQAVSDKAWLLELSELVQYQNIPEASTIQVFPNPAKDHLSIHSEAFLKATLFDIHGKRIQTVSGTKAVELPLGHIPSGLYFLHLTDDSGLYFVEKIIVAP